MTKLVLCQDCLRVHQVCDLIPSDNFPPGLCPACGGQTCGCGDCIASIDALARRDWDRTVLQKHVRPASWTPDGGLVEAPRAGT
jgi:hypothetical protein